MSIHMFICIHEYLSIYMNVDVFAYRANAVVCTYAYATDVHSHACVVTNAHEPCRCIVSHERMSTLRVTRMEGAPHHTCKVLRLRMWQEQPALVQQRCSPSHRYRPWLRHPVAGGQVDGSVHMHNVKVQPVYTKGQCTHTQAHGGMLREGERH